MQNRIKSRENSITWQKNSRDVLLILLPQLHLYKCMFRGDVSCLLKVTRVDGLGKRKLEKSSIKKSTNYIPNKALVCLGWH